MEPTVLVVSTAVDESTTAVIGELRRLGAAVVRFDTERFPFQAELTASLSTTRSLEWGDGLPSPNIASVWYRRVRVAERPAEMNAGVYDFCLRESRSTLLGMLLASGGRFMSPPAAVWAAENKIFQLETARRLGIPIPQTVVTNNPLAVREAFSRFDGKMVIKPARSGFVDFGTEQHAIFTNRFLEEHLERVEAARLCPAIYQEFVDKACDVRVTIVGRRTFVAEIDSQSDPEAAIDWRHTANPNLPHRPATLPAELEKRILALLDSLDLTFGAVDLVRAKDGSYKFLEINPNGQWLWLEDHLGFQISRAIAKWLAEGTS